MIRAAGHACYRPVWLTKMSRALSQRCLVQDKQPTLPFKPTKRAGRLTRGLRRNGRRLAKMFLFLASIVLFVLAIGLMKEGASNLTPLIRDSFRLDSPWRSLGFGWLFAYLIMSGSPVAAVALTFLDTGLLTPLSTFTMITGSRFGATFIVLLIGFIYVLRGRSRTASMTMGLLALMVTATTHLVALPIGIILLQQGWMDALRMSSDGAVGSILALTIKPLTAFAAANLPAWAIFVTGLGLIMLSFNLFDRCLPQMTLRESHLGATARLVYRPWVMFLLGAGVTLISMSVSISLGILVPLSARGFIRRENVIPYIMGANVTTFVDTVLAALLMDNALAFTVVMAEMVSMTIVSALVLILVYRPYEQTMLTSVEWCVKSNRNLTFFALLILLIPIVLIML